MSKEYNIDSDVWSVTSFNELRKEGMEIERKNLLNPGEKPEKSYVEKCLKQGMVRLSQLQITSEVLLIR